MTTSAATIPPQRCSRMKPVRINDNAKAVLLVLGVGTLCCAVFYLSGFHVFSLIGLAFIPAAFGCWALSVLLAGSRNQELYAKMTANEQERLKGMVKAYARRMALRLLPGLALIPLAVCWASLAHPQGLEGAFDYCVAHR